MFRVLMIGFVLKALSKLVAAHGVLKAGQQARFYSIFFSMPHLFSTAKVQKCEIIDSCSSKITGRRQLGQQPWMLPLWETQK